MNQNNRFTMGSDLGYQKTRLCNDIMAVIEAHQKLNPLPGDYEKLEFFSNTLGMLMAIRSKDYIKSEKVLEAILVAVSHCAKANLSVINLARKQEKEKLLKMSEQEKIKIVESTLNEFFNNED